MSKSFLNKPMKIKELELKNRIVMAPMCTYMVEKRDGVATDWHKVHYASRAVGGTGLIMLEATSVDPEGGIKSTDLGLWNDTQGEALKEIVDLVHQFGGKIAIQLSHAGRKAEDSKNHVSSSNLPYEFDDGRVITPKAMTADDIDQLVENFVSAAKRAIKAGFDAIEIHTAHGYLLHQFHSPGINKRDDEYGRDLSLLGTRVIKAVKAVIPEDMPLLLRISAIEYMDGGYKIDHSIKMAEKYIEAGIDCLDISSGGEDKIGILKPGNYPGYQLPFSKAFMEHFDIPIIAAGILKNPDVAEYALSSGQCDLVAVGRGMLNDPYWAVHAMQQRRVPNIPIPSAYQRGIRQTPEK